ncbi:hypothetical protein JW960_24045 [candidate division KSB1 bacterium]|nr:hypothetical protein [candidate division KSB1 bacterium]
MIEKINISLWEFFVYFLTGLLVSILVTLHYFLYNGFLNIQDTIILKIPAVLLLLIFPTLVILIGLILEPIVNYYGRIISIIEKKLESFSPNKDLKNWGAQIDQTFREFVKKDVPAELSDNIQIYNWCKDFIKQKNINTNFMVFLSMFGFYRNVEFIMLLNAISIFFLYSNCIAKYVFILISILLIFIFRRRSLIFYNHMSLTVYQNYIIARENSNNN